MFFKVYTKFQFAHSTSTYQKGLKMNDFLILRTFPNRREPAVEKVIRDGINMYNSARFVIVLNEKGEIVEKINGKHGFVGNFLVVLMPIVYKGINISLSVALEIGFGRATPYKQFEQTVEGETTTIKARVPVIQLSESFVIKILPLLTETIQLVVDSNVSCRKRTTFVKKNKGRQEILTTGSFIKIRHEEEVLSYVCLARDFETRVNGHLNRFAKNIICRLALLISKSSYYSDAELKKKRVRGELVALTIAVAIQESNYPTYIMEIVRDKIRKIDNSAKQYTELFDQILRVFKVVIPSTNMKEQRLYVDLDQKFRKRIAEFLKVFPLKIFFDIKRTKKRELRRMEEKKCPTLVHSKDCIVVEVKPSRELLLKRGELNEYQVFS